MIKLDEIVEAIKKINLNSFINFGLRAYYDKDNDSILYVEKDIVDEFIYNLDNDLINENDIYNNDKYLALVDFECIRFLRINIIFISEEVNELFTNTIKDLKLKEQLLEVSNDFKKYKIMLINNDLLNEYLKYKDNYLRTLAIEFLVKNDISYIK